MSKDYEVETNRTSMLSFRQQKEDSGTWKVEGRRELSYII